MVCQQGCYQQPQYILAQPNHTPENSGRKCCFHEGGDENLHVQYRLSSLTLTGNLEVKIL